MKHKGPLRWLRHLFTTPHAVRRAFPSITRERIRIAIAEGEGKTSGEIRFAIEASLPMSYLWRSLPPRARALMVFSKLRVWDTEYNNGVLIYVNLADHAVEIVADRGLARAVAQSEWDALCGAMRTRFKGGDFEGGALAGVYAVAQLLAQHFPLAAGSANPNEMADAPSVL
jgi:uncharacterized membrane protein